MSSPVRAEVTARTRRARSRRRRIGVGKRGSVARLAGLWMWRRTVLAWGFVIASVMLGWVISVLAAVRPIERGLLLLAGFTLGLIAYSVAALIVSNVLHRRWARLTELARRRGASIEVMGGREMPSEVLAGRGEGGGPRVTITLASGAQIGDWEYERAWSERWVRSAHLWGFITIPLLVSVPHLVLDARTNQRAHALSAGADFSPSQRLSLEGDFDDKFTVYCPSGYGPDALYFLTPDVMADLIDTAEGWDVEFVDDRVVFFRPGPILSTDESEIDRLIALAATWSGRAERWANWRDHRSGAEPVIGANGLLTRPPVDVHDDGRRLRDGRLATIAVIAVAALIGWMYVSVVFDMLAQ